MRNDSQYLVFWCQGQHAGDDNEDDDYDYDYYDDADDDDDMEGDVI